MAELLNAFNELLQRFVTLILKSNFNEDELVDLCENLYPYYVKLNISKEDDIELKVERIVIYACRREQLAPLLMRCMNLRPNENWREIYEFMKQIKLELLFDAPYYAEEIAYAIKELRNTFERQEYQKAKLYSVLNERFSNDDLKELSFLLEIDWDAISGENKKVKIMNLISHAANRRMVDGMIWKICSLRPDIKEMTFYRSADDSKD